MPNTKYYDPSRVLYMPSRRLYGYWMLLENIPGVLARVSKVFAGNNVNIVRVLVTSVEGGADSLFYCDFTDTDVKPEELINEFKEITEVRDIRIIKPVIPGLLIDDIHPIIMISGKRYIIDREDSFRGFIRGARDEFGSAGEALQYRIGLEMGRELWKGLDYYTEDVNDKLKILQLVFMNSGYGRMDIEADIDKKEANVKIYDSIECSQGTGAKEPYSHYIRGMLAGVFEDIFKDKVEVREVKCIALGDEYCKFTIGIRGSST
jgi:predicted hydrocarbon binding protein/predicted amino acid-binding ACT domain protein